MMKLYDHLFTGTFKREPKPVVGAVEYKGGVGSGVRGHHTNSPVTSPEYDAARLEYNTSKGTNDDTNSKLVKSSGIKIIADGAHEKIVERALAHVISEKQLLPYFHNVKVEVANLGSRYGTMKSSLYLDSTALQSEGAGFMASVIRHEIEHKILTQQGIPSSQQEGKVRFRTGMWASMKYGFMAKTNPKDAAGFKKAAILSGVQVKMNTQHDAQGRFGTGGDEKIVYHGTIPLVKDSIAKNGILPAKSTDRLFDEHHYRGARGNAAYVTTNRWTAETWGRNAANIQTQRWFESKYTAEQRREMPAYKALKLQQSYRSKLKVLVVECSVPKDQLKRDSHAPSDAFFIEGGISPKYIKGFSITKEMSDSLFIPIIIKDE